MSENWAVNGFKPPSPFAARGRYRPSGRFDPGRFLLWSLLTLAVSAVFAVLLHLAYVHDQYYVFVMPLLAAFLVGGMILLAVRHGHCRSRAAAALLGLAAATVLYPGVYALGLWSAAGTLDAAQLVHYVRWRMESQELESSGDGSAEEEEEGPDKWDVVINWAIFAGGAVTVLVFCLPLGWIRVGRDPYCERCGAWTRRELLLFPPETAEELPAALEDGTFADKAVELSAPYRPNVPAIVAAVDVCPRRVACRGRVSAWVSLKPTSGETGVLNPFHPLESMTGRSILARSVALTEAELEKVLPLLRPPEGAEPRKAASPLEMEDQDASGEQLARIDPVEEPWAGRILTRRNGYVMFAWNLAPLVGLIGGVGAAAAAVLGSETDPNWWLVVAGAVLAAVSAAVAIRGDYLGRLYTYRTTLRELASRTHLAVDPGAPDVYLVEMVPVENWGRAMLDEATDLGFLALDFKRQELRFEGDRERYQIPAGAVAGLALDGYQVANGMFKKQLVVLHVRTAAGLVVLPLALRYAPFFKVLLRGMEKCNLEFLERVFMLCSPGLNEDVNDHQNGEAS